VSRALDGATGALKLYFSLSTGAVVLFANHLARAHFLWPVLVPLAASILCFGFTASWRLCLLLASGNVRIIMGRGIADEKAPMENVRKGVRAWQKEARERAKWMGLLFWAGMAFAAIFVVVVVVVRALGI
jgi:inner membrane protein involved in colicin E2 resistance